jgi:alkylation response protein AidB-like acyl-CoA dehydrogenase
MDFGLNEQQIMLQTAAREFVNTEYSDKILKEMAKDPRGYTQGLWTKMAELGWTALSIPEAFGGIGDFLDLLVVLQEMGRAGVISPFFSSVVLGASTIIESGSEEQKQKYLPAIAEGKKIFTLALLEKSVQYIPETVQLEAKANTNGYILNGSKLFVPDANSADFIIVAARTKDGITLFVVDARASGVTCNLMQTFSPDKHSEVILQNVAVSKEDVLGELNQGWARLQKVLDKAAVATCALMVGGMERVLELTVSYAKDRNAFGHPIGAFQSIQHRCANMLMDLETSRFSTYQAAWRISQGMPAAKEAAIAKFWANQAYNRMAASAHQVFGGIGFTEDHALHWYTKRAKAQEFAYGGDNLQLDRLIAISKKPV